MKTAIPRGALCGCILENSPEGAARWMNHPGVDLLELRLDYLLSDPAPDGLEHSVASIMALPRLPIVATFRRKRDGGLFKGPEPQRLEVLRMALQAGAEWVDLEEDADRGPFAGLLEQVVLSHHDFHSTPERATLRRLAERMAATGARVIKVATHARSPEDNLNVLDLIPFGERELGVRVIAFCMGPLGRWSRLAGVLLGSPWAYVRLPGGPAAAPGQFTADEMRILLDTFRGAP